MAEFPEQIQAEVENINLTLNNLEITLDKEHKGVIEFAAIGTFLHNFYTGVEHIIKQTFRLHNLPLPDSETWHKDLLEKSLQENILSEITVEYLYKFLGFRHFFVHGYALMLNESKLLYLAEDVDRAWTMFLEDMRHYYRDRG